MIQNKTVIKVLNAKHGKKVIQYWKNQGFSENGFVGDTPDFYYGINSEGKLKHWGSIPNGYTEITLPPDLPQKGDRILVWDEMYEKPRERIFFAYLEGTKYPVVAVSQSDEEKLLKNQVVDVVSWKNYKLIEPIKEIELTLDEIATKFGINVEQLKIKK